METTDLKKVVEALLFVADRPLTAAMVREIIGDGVKKQEIESMIEAISADYDERNSPIELRSGAGGWQFSSRREYSVWVRKLFKEKTTFKLSNSALETLSVIAYKQPITRAEIEEIRGVDVSLETLLERKLIKIVGRKETIGRPLLYGTTTEFLRHFGLSHLSELPSLDEIAAQETQSSPEQDTETQPEESEQELSGDDLFLVREETSVPSGEAAEAGAVENAADGNEGSEEPDGQEESGSFRSDEPGAERAAATAGETEDALSPEIGDGEGPAESGQATAVPLETETETETETGGAPDPEDREESCDTGMTAAQDEVPCDPCDGGSADGEPVSFVSLSSAEEEITGEAAECLDGARTVPVSVDALAAVTAEGDSDTDENPGSGLADAEGTVVLETGDPECLGTDVPIVDPDLEDDDRGERQS